MLVLLCNFQIGFDGRDFVRPTVDRWPTGLAAEDSGFDDELARLEGVGVVDESRITRRAILFYGEGLMRLVVHSAVVGA